MPAAVDHYCAPISPYSYLGHARFAAIVDSCGLDRALLEAANAADVEDRRLAFTQQAIHRQVFGTLFYVVNGGIFWGQDRLRFVDEALSAG